LCLDTNLSRIFREITIDIYTVSPLYDAYFLTNLC
jgi:hypothetical protein